MIFTHNNYILVEECIYINLKRIKVDTTTPKVSSKYFAELNTTDKLIKLLPEPSVNNFKF